MSVLDENILLPVFLHLERRVDVYVLPIFIGRIAAVQVSIVFVVVHWEVLEGGYFWLVCIII